MEEQRETSGSAGRNIGGFTFGSDQDADLARAEQEKINYIEKRMDYSHPERVLSVYNRAIENRVFRTPVGFQYLQKVLEFLTKQGLGEQAMPIRLHQTFSYDLNAKVEKRTARKRVEPSRYLVLRRRLRRSLWLNLVLIFLVIALFIIMMTGKNPTILNYEQKLQNKYASWGQQLDEREREVRSKERELGLDVPAGSDTFPERAEEDTVEE